MISLKQAAEATGRTKPTILKAIKKGKISAKKDERGEWKIDPAELHRVYEPVKVNGAGNGKGLRQETPIETGGLQAKLQVLQEERDRERRQLEKTIDDLRERLDRTDTERQKVQAQLTSLLTDQREKSPEGRIAKAWAALKGKA